MGFVRQYGDALALVTTARPGVAPERVLRSLAAATSRPVRVIVADLGAEAWADAPDGAEIVRIAEDVGRAAAVNRSVASLDADVGWIAVADPQVEWGPDALDALLAAAAAHPRAGVLGPRVRGGSGAVLPTSGPLPTFADLLRGRIRVRRLAGGRVGWVAGACMLLRRAAFDSVDGFDPRYRGGSGPADAADVDLGDRLARAGWLALHVPAVEVVLHGEAAPGRREPAVGVLRRYVHDRYPAAARALMALAWPAGTTSRPGHD